MQEHNLNTIIIKRWDFVGISGIETSKNFVILNLHLLSSSHLNLSLIMSLNSHSLQYLCQPMLRQLQLVQSGSQFWDKELDYHIFTFFQA